MVCADKRQTLCEVSRIVEEIVLIVVTSNLKDTIELQNSRTPEHGKIQDKTEIEFTRSSYVPDGLKLEAEKRE
jgi:hypothetical protein